MSAQYNIPRNHPLRLLPMVYILPSEMLVQYPTLLKFPRGLGGIQASEEHLATLESDAFLDEVMRATARLVFPHFGLKGWIEQYSGYSPAWIFAYYIQVWAKAFEDETDFGLQYLFNLRRHEEVPFFNPEYVNEAMLRAVKRVIAEQNWQPILDVMREMPCHEDFEPWRNSQPRIDFLRKWYHSRASTKMISLEASMANANHAIHDMAASDADFVENVLSEDYIEQFKARLSPKDSRILELRMAGYTAEKIARELGYKNHSGVLKRIRTIAAAYEKYEDENTEIIT
ncbi:MAG: hypothetical protein FWE06_06260 [Oscillospiraceae bacterium]|nr:hypothetical protein [Oscillospiraceae bacterium]